MFDKFVSVCFENNNETKLFDDNVVYDLRLNRLLSESSLSVLSKKASFNDINERRGFFKEITEDGSVKDRFERISFCSDKVKYLDKKLSDSKNADCKSFIYVIFVYHVIEFIKSFTGLHSSCRYFSNVSEYFEEYLKTNKEIINNTVDLYNSIKTNNSFSLSYKKSAYRFSRSDNQNNYDLTLSGLENFLCIEQPDQLIDFDCEIIISEAVKKAGYYEDLLPYYEKYKDTDFTDLFSLTDEITFYSEISGLVTKNRKRNIPVYYPDLSDVREINLNNLYDISLSSDTVIPNDCSFTSDSGFYLIRGANGGGKTTFLRAVALNLLFLASGCPVFCESGSSFLPDKIFTHFPAPESFESGGRFQNEVERAEYIENSVTSYSFVAFNESFSGTNEEKGIEFASRTINSIKNKDCYGIFVTHHDISVDNVKILTPVIDGDNRTYKISGDESAYQSRVNDILKKYGIDKQSLESGFVSGEVD